MIDIDDDYDAPATMIDLHGPQAVEALARLARNVPPGVEIGRPLAAQFVPADQHAVRFLTIVGLFDSYPAHAERLLTIGAGADETSEWTSWCGGRETDRVARRTSDLRARRAVE